MSITIVTLEGDLLDALVAEHYGAPAAAAAFGQVLEANPGLAARGPVLPGGVRVVLPDIAPETGRVVRLWD